MCGENFLLAVLIVLVFLTQVWVIAIELMIN